MPAPGGERAALSRDLADFLIELSIALHKHAMYPEGHPSLAPAAAGVTRAAARLLQDRSTLSLGVARQQLVIEGVATDPKHPVLAELAGRLHRHDLGAMTFRRGVEAVEVAAVLKALAVDAERRGQPLGLGPPEGLRAWAHVQLHPLTYERLELVDDGAAASERGARAAQLWVGLARAALTAHAGDDRPTPTEPAVIARAIDDHPRTDAAAYDQVIVGYLLQIADELKTAGSADAAAPDVAADPRPQAGNTAAAGRDGGRLHAAAQVRARLDRRYGGRRGARDRPGRRGVVAPDDLALAGPDALQAGRARRGGRAAGAASGGRRVARPGAPAARGLDAGGPEPGRVRRGAAAHGAGGARPRGDPRGRARDRAGSHRRHGTRGGCRQRARARRRGSRGAGGAARPAARRAGRGLRVTRGGARSVGATRDGGRGPATRHAGSRGLQNARAAGSPRRCRGGGAPARRTRRGRGARRPPRPARPARQDGARDRCDRGPATGGRAVVRDPEHARAAGGAVAAAGGVFGGGLPGAPGRPRALASREGAGQAS